MLPLPFSSREPTSQKGKKKRIKDVSPFLRIAEWDDLREKKKGATGIPLSYLALLTGASDYTREKGGRNRKGNDEGDHCLFL